MTFYVSICEDMNALRASGAVSEDSPYRGMIDGRSGAHVQYSPDGTQSMIVLTSIDGLEALQALPYIIVTTYEAIFGYRRQVGVDEEGIPIMEEVAGSAELQAKYLSIHDYLTPDENGNTRPKFFAVPGGHSIDHIL